MLKNFPTLITILLILAQAPHAYCSSEKALTLTFPGQIQANFTLNSLTLNGLTLYYEGGLLEGHEGEIWIRTLNMFLEETYNNYRKMLGTGELRWCANTPTKAAKMPSIAFVFLESFPERANITGHNDRFGYDHKDNPGLIIKSGSWQNDSIKRIVAHEVLHRWCAHEPSRTPLENWKEEGAAEYLAYISTGAIPQLSISRYFDSPCSGTLYGGSFLWWLAYQLSKETKSGFLKILAELHLGMRSDLIRGGLAEVGNERCFEKTTASPFGVLAGSQTKLAADAKAVPYWITPWELFELKPRILSTPARGSFVWRGPVP